MTRLLYADLSPGRGWDGRDPEALEAAVATQVTTRTVSSFDPFGVAALVEYPRAISFLVDGTVADAPESVTINGTSEGKEASEALSLVTLSTRDETYGVRARGAVSSTKTWSAIDSIVFTAGVGTDATIAIGLGLIQGVRDVRGKLHITTLINLLDLDHDGLIDPIALNEYTDRASNEVDAVLSGPEGNFPVNGPDGRVFAFPPPPMAGDLAGDYFVAFLGARYPTVILADHQWFAKEATRKLNELRKAYRGTGKPEAEPPANVGGAVLPRPQDWHTRSRWNGRARFGIF